MAEGLEYKLKWVEAMLVKQQILNPIGFEFLNTLYQSAPYL